MKYISTRGFGYSNGRPQNFGQVLLSGLAPDGGLFVPEEWPDINKLFGIPLPWNLHKDLSFTGWADVLIPQFTGEDLNGDLEGPEIESLVHETYRTGAFRHEAITPLVQVGDHLWVMELFHGPTIAFKDIALQFLGKLFDHVLERQSRRITIVGATSGDTGSAAIEGCRACKNLDIFILHPKGRVSEVQRRQMTSVDAPNVHNIALEGTFDDCQNIVKALFGDERFREEVQLSAVNSINWARIMAQIIYYVRACQALGGAVGKESARTVSFAVPTGNFGNVYAAYAARKMGVPVGDLMICSNRNDILTRFFETGEMRTESVQPSLSPSMDIQISSNFERYLFDLYGRDHERLARVMQDFKKTGVIENCLEHTRAAQDFTAHRCNDEETLAVIRRIYDQTGGYIVDPHTAVGLSGALAEIDACGADSPVVALACAHPAKFPDAVRKAIGKEAPLPDHLADLFERKEKFKVLPNDLKAVKSYVRGHSQVSRKAA